MTSSDDGVHLAAASWYAPVYTSSDSGATWIARQVGSLAWTGLTASSDGKRLSLADRGTGMAQAGFIYRSTDYGAHWTAMQTPGQAQWRGLAGSADGLVLAAIKENAVVVAHASTPVGTSGTLGGGQFDTVTFQYDGNGLFAVTALDGTLALP